MAHEYSVQIHDWITKKYERAKAGKKAAEKNNDSSGNEYYSGQLEELDFIRNYLSDRIDLDTHKYYE